MKLTLDRMDLLPEYEQLSTSKTKFEHFNDEAKTAIIAVGKAIFQSYDRELYNAIYAPRIIPKTVINTRRRSKI